MLIALLSNGCAYETGDEGAAESAGEENLGEVSQALASGYWLPTFLTPLAAMQTSDGVRQVCRAWTGSYQNYVGWTNGATCYYAANNRSYATTDMQRVERTGLAWADVARPCRTTYCENNVDPNKIVGSAGFRICEAKIGSVWRSGYYSGESCYVADNAGGFETYRWRNGTPVRYLVKP